MSGKRNYLKYVAIVLAVVFLVAAALLALSLWESRQGQYSEVSTEDGVLTHNGKEYVLKSDIETFLVLGLDKYENTTSVNSGENGVRADFLMLFVFNNNTKQCSAIHINRDTMTSVNMLGIGGTKVDTLTKQISLAYSYVADENDKVKCGNTKDAVEKLLCDIDVNHYFSMTMDCVAPMNDLVGGVEVTVLDDFSSVDPSLVKGEKVTLMGEQALRYVRSRYGLDDSSNNARMARQQQYINALYQKTLSLMEADEEFALKFADTLDEYVVYDSSNEKMKKFAEKIDEYEFLGIKELKGETKAGERFIEFYPDQDALLNLVIETFYIPKE